MLDRASEARNRRSFLGFPADLQSMFPALGQKGAGAIRNGELEILPAKRQVRYRGEALAFTALE